MDKWRDFQMERILIPKYLQKISQLVRLLSQYCDPKYSQNPIYYVLCHYINAIYDPVK